jgi:cyanate lyase
MVQARFNPSPRQALAASAVNAKIARDLTCQQIADAAGLSVVFTTAAILGQHPLPENAAQAVAELLGLGDDAAKVLQTIPTRGSIPGGVPTDPTIYRLYSMMQLYGQTLKQLVHEQYGDGMINFQARREKSLRPRGRRTRSHHPRRQILARQAILTKSIPPHGRDTTTQSTKATPMLRRAEPGAGNTTESNMAGYQ